ncbi:MAG: IS1595 family transposase [Hyphomicrobiales bacterium]
MSSNLQNPIFTDEAKAREWLEARVWPHGPVCPHCGVTSEHVTSLRGKAHRAGVYQCNECREQFTVTVNTVFERSKVPLCKWMAAVFMLTASKKGVSAHQIHRSLDVSYKTAWFMMHRLREAMRSGGLAPLGGSGKAVEVDETFIGRLEGQPKGRSGRGHKNTVLTLVERGGSARSFHIDGTTVADVAPIVRANISRMTRLNTDEATHYHEVGAEFVAHEAVNHGQKEYARYEDERLISTNTVEGFYSIFKRGMKGVYQHCKEKHLHRYLAEFDFRYSNRVKLGVNDEARAEKLAKGIVGKRLTYRRTNRESDAPPF